MEPKLKIRTVATVTAAYGGGLVDALPVREVAGSTQTPGGLLVAPIEVIEAADGIPVRFVADAVVLNSVGQPVASTPVKGGNALDIILGAGGLDYAFFDFTATDRLFQENTGPTPADDIGEAIGLVIGRAKQGGKTFAQVMTGQPDLLVPGTWEMSVAGGTSTATESPVGQLNLTPDGVNQSRADQSFATVVGVAYALSVNVLTGMIGTAVGPTKGSTASLSATAPLGLSVYYFTATSTTTWIRFTRTSSSASVNQISAKAVPAHYALQAGGSFKPILQAAGAKFDGSDDGLKSDTLPGKVIIAQFTSPASLGSAAGLVAGSAGVSGANCFQLGVDNTGKLVGGAGGQSFTTIVGNNASILGVEAIAAIWAPGTGQTLKMFCDAAEVYSAAQFGAVSTTNVVNIGNRNINGADDRYFGGHVKRVAFGSPASFTLAEFQQIRSQWLAA